MEIKNNLSPESITHVTPDSINDTASLLAAAKKMSTAIDASFPTRPAKDKIDFLRNKSNEYLSQYGKDNIK